MIQQMKDAAKAVGIVALITNSTDRIETQLNSLTKEEKMVYFEENKAAFINSV